MAYFELRLLQWLHVGNFFSHFSIFFFLKVPKVVGLTRHWVLLKYASSVTGIIPDTKMWKKKKSVLINLWSGRIYFTNSEIIKLECLDFVPSIQVQLPVIETLLLILCRSYSLKTHANKILKWQMMCPLIFLLVYWTGSLLKWVPFKAVLISVAGS